MSEPNLFQQSPEQEAESKLRTGTKKLLTQDITIRSRKRSKLGIV